MIQIKRLSILHNFIIISVFKCTLVSQVFFVIYTYEYIQCGYCKYISLGIFEAVLQLERSALVFIETVLLQTKCKRTTLCTIGFSRATEILKSMNTNSASNHVLAVLFELLTVLLSFAQLNVYVYL